MNCIIIEDEIPAQKIVLHYISKIPELNLTGCFQSALEANHFLQVNSVDLIFLDINLPDIDGLQYIKTLSRPPKIIMTTAYPEYAAESFELDTICDYLVKPFSFERFLRAINKAKSREGASTEENGAAAREGVFYINIDKSLHKIIPSDILYIVSDKNYVTILTTKRKLTYIASLKKWIEKLPSANFLQVHKSFVVNLGHIDKVSGNRLYINGEQVPIGRKYREALLEKLK